MFAKYGTPAAPALSLAHLAALVLLTKVATGMAFLGHA